MTSSNSSITTHIDPSKIHIETSEAAISIAHSFTGLAICLIVISTMVFSARIWTRTHPVFCMSTSDYLAIAAYISVITCSALLLQTTWWVFTGDAQNLTLLDAQNSFKFAIIAQVFWTFAICFTKFSVAAMLLRFEQVPRMRRFLWFMIFVISLQGLYGIAFQLTQCIPLRLAWDFLAGSSSHGKCWAANAGRASSIAIQSVNVVTDWIFAFLPISFLRKVQRPLRERIIVGILMGLGFFAGVTSFVKIGYLAVYGKSGDTSMESIRLGLFSATEALLAFTAACVPCLRAPFQRVLEYFGLVSAQQRHQEDDSDYSMDATTTPSTMNATTSTGTAVNIKGQKGRAGSNDGHSDTQVLTRGRTAETNYRDMENGLSEEDRNAMVMEIVREQETLEMIRKNHTTELQTADTESGVDLMKIGIRSTPHTLGSNSRLGGTWDEEADEDPAKKGMWWAGK